jgi:hypothetical protein
MKRTKNNKKKVALATLGFFVLMGIYNSVVINSESHLSNSDAKLVKRLDEVYGVVVNGRKVAGTPSWKKLNTPDQIIVQKENVSTPQVIQPEVISTAAVKEELSLSLIEVINEKKWKDGLATNQFNGSLITNNGVIESLQVNLPQNQAVNVQFSEMTGNTFEYDLNGEIFTGLMYQVDSNAYMITLTSGPLEGTRLRFSDKAPVEEQQQTQELLAESNVQIGNFGQENAPEQMIEVDQALQHEAVKSPSFNLDQSQTM